MHNIKPYLQLFIFGALAILGALVVQVFYIVGVGIFTGTPQSTSFYDTNNLALAFFVAALSEEVLRGVLVQRSTVLLRYPSPFFAGLFFGLGFACVEFFSAVFTGRLEHVPVWMIFTTIGLHIILSILFFFAFKKYHNLLVLGGTLFIAVLTHFFYNNILYMLTLLQ